MLQRIQTLFLLLFCGVSLGNFFFFPVEIDVFSRPFGQQAALLGYMPLVLTVIIFATIFLYKQRPRQVLINRVVWVIFTLYWGSFVYFILQSGNSFALYLPDLSLAFVGEVALLLANRFIKKDEALVRSLDRLR